MSLFIYCKLLFYDMWILIFFLNKKSLVRTSLNGHTSRNWSLNDRYIARGRDKHISKHWFKPNSHMFHLCSWDNLTNVTPRFAKVNKIISLLVPQKMRFFFQLTLRPEFYLLRFVSISHSSITSWISSQQQWLWTLTFKAATSCVKWEKCVNVKDRYGVVSALNETVRLKKETGNVITRTYSSALDGTKFGRYLLEKKIYTKKSHSVISTTNLKNYGYI
jgi:hypothetical protein